MSRPVILGLAISISLSLSTAAAFAQAAPSAPQDSQTVSATLSPAANDIARDLGLLPLIEKLQTLNRQAAKDNNSEIERLKTFHTLNTKVLIATLQVRDVTARIERELAIINRQRGLLQDRRDRAIKLNSIENIVASGGMSEIATAGQFATNENPANVVQLVANAATIGLGGWALHQQTGARQKITTKPNMLAQVFNLPTDKDSVYPDVVWSYLNKPPSGEPKPRLQGLHERWRRFKVIPNSSNAPDYRKRIAILTNTSRSGTANIDIFDDQSDMLFDLRAEVFQMDRDLLEVLLFVQAL
jgi:hypothetical protein